MAKLVSIVVPIYNEEKGIALFWQKLSEVLKTLSEFEFEIIFVNDGSSDNSVIEIKKLINNSIRIKHIEFSRNFGKESALSAGLNYCHGDCAIMIDADLQHPPELIKNFLNKWQNGAEVVIGIRTKNNDEGLIKRIGSCIFYKIMNRIGETKISPRATDFRLIERGVINEFKKFTETNRITRGLIDWLGFKREFVEFESPKRQFGTATYSTTKLFKLAFSSFINHSLLPLKLAGYLGLLIMFSSGAMGIYIIINQYILNNNNHLYFSGIGQLAVLMIFLIGLVLSCLGLIALYVGNIQNEAINRPVYVIRKTNIQ